MAPQNSDTSYRGKLVAAILASGAALVPSNAEASVISFPLGLNDPVGFGFGTINDWSTQFGLEIRAQSFGSTSSAAKNIYLIGAEVGSAVNFGARWTGPGGSQALFRGQFTSRWVSVNTSYSSGYMTQTSSFNFPNGAGLRYFLFRFADNNVPGGFDYGYISLTIAASRWDVASVQVNSIYYDDSGELIAAGDTATATPEPSTLALAALALGAAAITKRKRAA